ncbi:MAG: hypothetical protein EOO89_27625, partial [Pedobacter sp.]
MFTRLADLWTVVGLIDPQSRITTCGGDQLGGVNKFNQPGYMERTYSNLPPHNTISFVIYTFPYGTWTPTDTLEFYVDDGLIKTFNPSSFMHTPFMNTGCGRTELRILGHLSHSTSSLKIKLQFSVNGIVGSFAIRDLGIRLTNSSESTNVCTTNSGGWDSFGTDVETTCNDVCDYRNFDKNIVSGTCSQTCDSKCYHCYG